MPRYPPGVTNLGPYEFTAQDVERTLANGRTLFDLLPGGFPPDPEGVAAPYRARAEAALALNGAVQPSPHGLPRPKPGR